MAARLGLKRSPESYLFTAKHVVDMPSDAEGGIITIRKTSRGMRKFVKVGYRWRYLHHHVWEQFHGPVPAGHLVRFRDNDPMHVEIQNLYLVSAAELAEEFRQTDEYVAARLSRAKGRRAGFDREMYRKVLLFPELIDLKRRQLALGSILKHREDMDEPPECEESSAEKVAGRNPAAQDVPREVPLREVCEMSSPNKVADFPARAKYRGEEDPLPPHSVCSSREEPLRGSDRTPSGGITT
jgi:hypothetical protein